MGCEIQIFAQFPMIKLIEEAHKIVRNPTPRRMLPDDIALHFIVGRHLIRLETPEIQSCSWIGFRYGQIGQAYFIKTIQLHRPKHIAPCFIELICGLIFFAQIIAEGFEILRSPR